MNRSDDEDPRRWRDAPPGAPGADNEIAAAARRLAEAPGWDDVRIAQVKQGLWQRRLPRTEAPARGAWPARAWVLAAVSLLLGSATTAVAERALRRHQLEPTMAPHAAPTPGAQRSRRLRVTVPKAAHLELAFAEDGASVAVLDGDAELAGSMVGAPVPLGPGQAWREAAAPPSVSAGDARATPPREPATAAGNQAHAVEATSPPPGGHAVEATSLPPRQPAAAALVARARHGGPIAPLPISAPARQGIEPTPFETPPAATPGDVGLLAEAVRTLRSGDATAALAEIERVQREFPTSALAREAALLRAEALLVLGREAAALLALDPIALDGDVGDRRASLARGELRVAAGRCVEAVADFGRVLAADARDELAARAFYGRGACALASGDRAGARGDLSQALRLFPAGERRAAIDGALKDLAR